MGICNYVHTDESHFITKGKVWSNELTLLGICAGQEETWPFIISYNNISRLNHWAIRDQNNPDYITADVGHQM